MRATVHLCFSFSLVSLFAWTGPVLNSPAATYYVTTVGDDGQAGTNWATAKLTIQAGVNAATNVDDEVVVSNGLYYLASQISISTAITVRSENGRDYTAVNGSNTVRCLSITSPGVVIDGFTITNANNTASAYGGGVYMTGGTVTNCIISGNSCPGNSANGKGGAIYMTGGTVADCIISSNSAYYQGGGTFMTGGTLENSSFTSNSVTEYNGGGMYISAGTVTECTFTGNTANQWAGGICVVGGVIRNCVMTGNSATGPGGCIYMFDGIVTNCIISGNSATSAAQGQGGGIYIKDGGTILDCIISSNSACFWGGGISIANAGPQVQNSVISYNRVTTYDGGGVYMANGLLQNCLVIGNLAARWGGGVRGDNGIMENCTVVGNQSGTRSGGVDISANLLTVTNTIIYFNDAPSYVNVYPETPVTNLAFSCTTPSVPGTGNITNNPLFVDPGSEYGTNHVAGDYHLKKGSDCINTGTNLGWMANATDLDGNARILARTVDMGAYEAVPPPSGTMFSVR